MDREDIEKLFENNGIDAYCVGSFKKAVKDIDGDLDTKSHSHDINEEYVELSSGEKVTYDQLATRWGFYKEGKPDASFIKEKFKEKRQEDKKTEDVIEELDEEYEDPRQTDTRR